MPHLYTPPDLLHANEVWGANCGPGALAAVLRRPVMDMRPFFPGWTTPTTMRKALAFLQHPVVSSTTLPPTRDLRGVAFLQFHGRWDTAPVVAQYRHTHWVGLHREQEVLHVYDVNVGSAGGWAPATEWEKTVLPSLAARHNGASGKWSYRLVLLLNESTPNPPLTRSTT